MVKRGLSMVFIALPMAIMDIWLLSWWLSGGTTLGGVTSLPGMLSERVAVYHLANFWFIGFSGCPLGISMICFSIIRELRAVADDVAHEVGLGSDEAHALLVSKAERIFKVDVAMMLLLLTNFDLFSFSTVFEGTFFLEGLSQTVLGVVVGIGSLCIALAVPKGLSVVRVTVLREEGVRVMRHVDNELLPLVKGIMFSSCVAGVYTTLLVVSNPPFPPQITRQHLPDGDPCQLPPNATFAPFVSAGVGCAAAHQYLYVKVKFIAAISLWIHALFGLALAAFGKYLNAQQPKWPIAPFVAHVFAGFCMCVLAPFALSMVICGQSEITERSWLISLGSSFWIVIGCLLTWLLVFVLLQIEFVLRRLDGLLSGSELEVALRGGKREKLRDMLSAVVSGYLEGVRGAAVVAGEENKFAGEPSDLVTGKPVDAPLGIEHFMKVGRSFQFPPLDGVEAIAKELATSGTDGDRECLHYILHARAGSSELTFSNGNLRRDCTKDGEIHPQRLNADGLGMSFADFCNDERAATIAHLTPPHVLALRLYTTAAYRSLNTPLRDVDPSRAAHGFPFTIKYICDGISKLRAVEASTGKDETVDLWRGLKNIRVQDDFMRHGGTELAPMSTTTDLRIAVQYSLGDSSLLFKLRTPSFMQRGADLGFLSAFPDEREILFPPLTFLRPTGKHLKLDFGKENGVKYTVVEVEPIFGS
jgi:hypothetical protein